MLPYAGADLPAASSRLLARICNPCLLVRLVVIRAFCSAKPTDRRELAEGKSALAGTHCDSSLFFSV